MSPNFDYSQPLAAAGANIFAFRHMIEKSALQKGITSLAPTRAEGLIGGLKSAPTVGVMVGTQMIAQKFFEEKLLHGQKPTLTSTLLGSAVVGLLSVPAIAVFNGQTMRMSPLIALRGITPLQAALITVQETAFVTGISAEKVLNANSSNIGVEYGVTYVSGAIGSLAGHGANTALTRLQAGLPIANASQLFLGALTKARATGLFAMCYKLGLEFIAAAQEGKFDGKNFLK